MALAISKQGYLKKKSSNTFG